MFWKSGVVHSFKMVDPVLFGFGFHALYSRDPDSLNHNLKTALN